MLSRGRTDKFTRLVLHCLDVTSWDSVANSVFVFPVSSVSWPVKNLHGNKIIVAAKPGFDPIIEPHQSFSSLDGFPFCLASFPIQCRRKQKGQLSVTDRPLTIGHIFDILESLVKFGQLCIVEAEPQADIRFSSLRLHQVPNRVSEKAMVAWHW